MADQTDDAIKFVLAQEQLRQESETFNSRKRQDDLWFILQLVFGYTAAVLLPTVAIVCVWIIFNPNDFTASAITAASAALFVDILGFVLAAGRFVLGKPKERLAPVTTQPVEAEGAKDQAALPKETGSGQSGWRSL